DELGPDDRLEPPVRAQFMVGGHLPRACDLRDRARGEPHRGRPQRRAQPETPGAMMTGRLLQVQDLHVEFRSRRGRAMVLNGVSFDVKSGETLCVVGESGCGKSMTALALLRLIPSPPGRISGGKVLLQGTDLLEASER